MAEKKMPTEVVINTEKQDPVPMTMISSPDQEPIPMVIVAEEAKKPPLPGHTVKKGEGVTLSPTTTEQEDEVSAGQQRVNLIWENTQSKIALFVVGAGILMNSAIIFGIVIFHADVNVNQLSLISISLQFINLTVGIVIGFYFSRTNHSARGGIGPKFEFPYTGR